MSVWLWRRVILQLRRRGRGQAESGAFLLTPQKNGDNRVSAFVCYDDLDPDAYEGGAIAFHAAGHSALWNYCEKRGLRVLADIHTHPGDGIGQSPTDQQNPMVPLCGHVAVIAPRFGKTPWWTLAFVGVYEYLGNFQWRDHKRGSAQRRIKLTLW